MADRQRLLPPNATPLERALEQACGRIEDVPVPLRDLWDPERCPSVALPWLAWALSLDRWDPDWPDDVKRCAVMGSVEVHRRKGTLSAVERVLMDLGAVYEIEERPGGENFRMAIRIFNSGSLFSGAVDEIRDQVDSAKRASVHYTLSLAAGAELTVPLAAAAAGVTVADLRLEVDV